MQSFVFNEFHQCKENCEMRLVDYLTEGLTDLSNQWTALLVS
jgi:hypothetical protein